MRGDLLSGARAKTAAAATAVALLAAALAAIGAWMLFSHFAGYDDEGYILMSAREYFAHGRLYDLVYTQYGPAFYVLIDFFQHVFGPVDNTLARLLTLGLWLGTAGSCAVMVRRETRSWSLTLFTFAATFLYLYFLSDEPFHPGALIIFILAASTASLLALLRAGRPAAVVIVAAITGSVLLLTKINVGVFYFAAVGAWALLNATSGPLRRMAPFLVVVGLTALAAALMHTLWGETWIHVYLSLFAVGAVTVILAFRGGPAFDWRHGGYFVLAATGVALVVLTAVWLRGTSVAGLLDGVLIRPLRHPGSYSYPVDWRPGSVLVGAISLAIAFAHYRLRRVRADAAADGIITTLRVVQAGALLIAFVLLMHARVIGAVFSYVAPLIWISVMPLSGIKNGQTARRFHGDDETLEHPAISSHDSPAAVIEGDAAGAPPRPDISGLGRGLLAMILLLQYLHAYPVGGSQESWGTFLLIPLVALGLGDLRQTQFARRWPLFAGTLIAVVIGKIAWTAVETHRVFASRLELGLPGASALRLPENMRTAYRVLAINAAAHAEVLFSLPGMYSFNLWTGLPAPTAKNTTLWFTLLTEPEQLEIVRSLEQQPRACVIVHESLVALMKAGNISMRGPLIDYIHQNFARAFQVEGFAFLIRTGRQIAPLNIAQFAPPAAGIHVCLVGDGRSIASIETVDLLAPSVSATRPIARDTKISLTPINSMGQPAGRTSTAQLPLQFTGLARVSFEIESSTLAGNQAMIAFNLRDRDGRLLGTVRFDE